MDEFSMCRPEENDVTMCDEDDANGSMLAQIMKMKQQRLKLLQDFNKEHEHEIIPLMKEIPEVEKKKEITPKPKKKIETPCTMPTRRSQRICLKSDEDHKPKFYASQAVFIERPPNDYGHMPGVEVGHHWETRMECSYDGVHRPTVAGIHGGPHGAYSIALSGGYPEDVDEGYTFTYTGAGGRDLKGTAMKPKNLRTAPQTKDQELEGVNYSLVKSIETGKPVRVIRGYKSDSVFAPETGYRYDGLYKVVKYWEDYGKTGFRIFRFKMVRLDNQAPPPWEQPKKIYHRYNSTDNENKNPNSDSVYESETTNDNSDHFIDKRSESELDDEINDCCERLCRNSMNASNTYESLNDVTESSFCGWE